MTPHKLDTEQQVLFYEQEFYMLSNFSSFRVKWRGVDFDTSEAAYHWEKFRGGGFRQLWIRFWIRRARSAHEAFKTAEKQRAYRRPNWNAEKYDRMYEILCAKTAQHEYVRRKLLETGERELIEDSWRDDEWGWGPDRNGQNRLGKIWMRVREDLKAGKIG